MKQFEAFLGNGPDFRAWQESDTVKITQKAKTVEIAQELPDGRKAVTVFNLSALQAYAIVE